MSVCVALAAQNFADLRIERAVTGAYRFLNSPFWVRDGGFVLFADSPTNRVLRWTPGGKVEKLFDEVQGPAGIASDSQGRIWICESRARRVVRADRRQRLEPVAEKFQGKRFNAPNDIAVRKDGNAYFTDPAFGYQQDARELDFYGVFHVTPKGDVEAIARWQTRPDGIALSANGRLLYVGDADRKEVRVFDLDRAGAASGERVFASKLGGPPRGMCVDEKGNLYVSASKLAIFTAEGMPLHAIDFSAPTTGCTFGEADLGTLFVPAGGILFRLRLDVKGAAQN